MFIYHPFSDSVAKVVCFSSVFLWVVCVFVNASRNVRDVIMKFLREQLDMIKS